MFRSGELKEILEKLYKTYSRRYSSKDPVWVLHQFSDKRDTEIIGLITSAYAYGSVDQINSFVAKFLQRIGNKPYEFTINFTKRKDKKHLAGLNYRFNSDIDLIRLIEGIGIVLKRFESLESAFIAGYRDTDENVLNALNKFSSVINNGYRRIEGSYYHYLLPNASSGSTCKRLNLYLRWMVRKDEIDLGLWKGVSPGKLIMPVDTHIARVSKKLKLVKRKTVDMKFAIELTEKLKKFDPIDPVKYDFSLCHIGIEKKSIDESIQIIS